MTRFEDAQPLTACVRRLAAWTDPVGVATGLREAPGLAALVANGSAAGGRWSHVAAEPDMILTLDGEGEALFEALRDPALNVGVIGLAAYDAGARPATGAQDVVWPDLMLARYPAMLRFDHHARTVEAVGRGIDAAAAEWAVERALGWLKGAAAPTPPAPPAGALVEEGSGADYEAAVADVVARIAAGELFQANIARAWNGRLKDGADPFDVFLRLQAGRASAYGAVWRLDDRAVVSNSPELFLGLEGRRLETRPIKGTRPRADDAAADAALAAELAASAKDRAENLMIVDLMRNDLAQISEVGSVAVAALCVVESHPTVHHLVSVVTSRLRRGLGPADVLAATFPPGSITGAPKHQAMKVIARHEPPRGPWCGSLFLVEEGRMTASVLIRTASFEQDAEGWRFRTLAGAGIVADSVPAHERSETEVKIKAMAEALTGDQSVSTTSPSRG
ncbi:anthranilate synthase component I family protein [uncultured Brevundimonas sp.]|uniref:anthranilate synthase component I family protein n=1 Tax=uncultured Brevundimonas sp. TaxID=213418 RepID=UPI0025E4E7A6|nr:anthranilate synthase component I family protein [uncultured Brevundimonas sp.]